MISMRDELRDLADVFYADIVKPSSGININWIRKTMMSLGIRDESIDNLYIINAPLSREVWYYTLMRMYEEKKLHKFLNLVLDKMGGVDLGALKDRIEALGIYYQDGRFFERTFNIVVLVSGRGTNLQALIDAVENGEINGKIVAVVSNRKNAYALERARKHGIDAIYIPAKKGESREDYDRRLAKIVDDKEADLIVLAGFLRILSPWFVRRYRWKVINIHPSLLPAFAGLYGENVHRAVIEHGCKVSGCTVHFVDEEVDHGPIIVQRCVEVRDDDTPETLAARVLEKEHECLVEAVRLISEGRVTVEGRRTRIKG